MKSGGNFSVRIHILATQKLRGTRGETMIEGKQISHHYKTEKLSLRNSVCSICFL